MITDTERIDALETFVEEHGAVVLHTGATNCHGMLGLGLRPGYLVRSLRKALDTLVARAQPVPESAANAETNFAFAKALGAREMLERIRGSLRTWPLGGCDAEIDALVQRIYQRGVTAGQLQQRKVTYPHR
jgi:hypothetical protein